MWVTPITGGEIRFDDWGYVGPNGRNATDFSSVNGFGGPAEGNALDLNGGIGQIQHVVTKDPDGLTPDDPYHFSQEFTTTHLYLDANTDAQVNFYDWGYTTVGGSTFDNMRIDYDGDYMIDRYDMNFQLYETFVYTDTGGNPTPPTPLDDTYPVNISFKPYALSNATGWCGSILASNPAALEAMAGQIQFDFGFEVFFYKAPDTQVSGEGNMQIISGFQMRSYGSITLDITTAAGALADLSYSSSAVVNNTSPTGDNVNPGTGLPEVGGGDGPDPAWYNQVSFMGAGIIPVGVWVLVDESEGITYRASNDLAIRHDQILRVAITDGGEAEEPVEEIPAGTTWMYHLNSFGNYTFLMRADGIRVIEASDYTKYPDLTDVPTVTAGVAYNDDESGDSQLIADLGGTPDAFAFIGQTDVALNTLRTSNTVTIANLPRETVISVTGGKYKINTGAFTSERGVIVNGDTVQLQNTSSNSYSTTLDTVLAVGSASETFGITTEPAPDTTPDAFSFNDQFNLGLNELVYSNSITVTDINAAAAISITNAVGEYKINSGSYTSLAGTVNSGDVVTVRHWTAATDLSTVDTVLDIGGVSDTFSSSTQVDTTPNAFSFTDQVDVGLDTAVLSDIVTISGINMPATISITGGQYRINSGSWVSVDGTVDDTDTVQILVQSSLTGPTTTDAILTIGGVSDTFSVTTASDVDADGIIDILDNCTQAANADQLDTDGDLYGNACDADFNNDGIVNSLDTGPFKAAFYTSGNIETDLNGDSIVNSLDLGIYKKVITLAPGPSGLVP